MIRKPLAITGMGMISCLGEGAEINAAAMRCGYDGFQVSDKLIMGTSGIRIAISTIPTEIRGNTRLAMLETKAIEDLISSMDKPIPKVAVIICFSNSNAQGKTSKKDQFDIIKHSIKDSLKESVTQILGFSLGRVSFVKALEKTKELIYSDRETSVLIISVDSLLSSHIINFYLGKNSDENRLLTSDNPNGFISGEAATAILFTRPTTNDVCITGIGFGNEKVDIYSDEVSKAEGLVEATNQALTSANITSGDTDFRIASVSGESYFFKELAITHSKTMTGPKSDHPLWHPADSIGETGAAVGGAMVIMSYYAFKKKYAPGQRALCHISNDDELRGTFIIEQT